MIHFVERDIHEFAEYLRPFAGRGGIRVTFLHHTYVPDVSQWHGLASMESIRGAHRRRGGRDIFGLRAPGRRKFFSEPPLREGQTAMALYRRRAEGSAHRHTGRRLPTMRKQTYSWAEITGSILTAIALWLFATLLLGTTVGLAWAVARSILRMIGG